MRPLLPRGLLAALFFMPLTRAASAQERFPLLTTDTLRLACAFASDTTNPAPSVRAFCGAKLTKSVVLVIPTITEIRGAALHQPVTRSAGGTPTIPGLASTVGLPSQDLLITGFTDFVVDRAKDEAQVYLINGFVQPLCDRKVLKKDEAKGIPEVKTREFLPATCELLTSKTATTLRSQGFVLPSWGVVQTALRRDVDTLPMIAMDRAASFVATRYQGGLQDPRVRRTAQRVIALAGASRLGVTYVDRHDLSRAFRESAIAMSHMMDSVCAVKRIAGGAGSTGGRPGGGGGGGDVAQAADCLDWSKMPVARALMTTAAYVGVSSESDLEALFGASPATRADALDMIVKAILVNGRGALTQQEPYLRRAIASLVADYGVPASADSATVQAAQLESHIAAAIEPFRDAVADVQSKLGQANGDHQRIMLAYADGVESMALAMQTALRTDAPPSDESRQLDTALTVVVRLARLPRLRLERNYYELLAEVMTLPRILADNSQLAELESFSLPDGVTKALQFAVDASKSTDADAFQATLEHYAAPANGFLRKRTSTEGGFGVYWSVNAYVGYSRGTETAVGNNVPLDAKKGRADYSGMYVPAGIEIGFRNTPFATLGVLAQLIDVGQVASWRSNQDSTSKVETGPPGLTLASVFAPGGTVLLNIHRLPVALGWSWARAPQFRNLTQSNDPNALRATVTRSTGFIAIDVPLIP